MKKGWLFASGGVLPPAKPYRPADAPGELIFPRGRGPIGNAVEARRLADVVEAKAMIHGDGVGRPLGILTSTAVAEGPAPDLQATLDACYAAMRGIEPQAHQVDMDKVTWASLVKRCEELGTVSTTGTPATRKLWGLDVVVHDDWEPGRAELVFPDGTRRPL